MKVYEAISEALVAEGVEVFFGLIAGGVDNVIRHLVDVKKIRYVQVRHEEAAIGMADGYSRATGGIGVAVIDGGPGLANASAPLMAARQSGSRLLVLCTGEKPNRHVYEVVDRHNNMSFDQAPLMLATAGAFHTVRGPDSVAQDVAQAFRHIRLGKGPLILTFSEGAAAMPDGWRYQPAKAAAPRLSGAPRPADVQALARRIEASRRPLILAGRGAWRAGAKEALSALAERSGALIATTLLGKDMFAGDPYGLGVSGGFALEDARPIMKEADLVIAFGAQLNDYTMGHGQLYGRAGLVQVDINPAAFDEYQTVDQAVAADARLTAEALLLALDKTDRPDWRGPAMAARIKGFERWRGREMDEPPGRANIRRVVDALDRFGPKARQLCVDIGLFMGPPSAYIQAPDPDAQVFPWQLGRVGCGLPVAAGAALGRKDRLMMAVVGDGGMMAAMNALDTIASERIPMLIVVMDDAGYGADRHIFELQGEKTRVADMRTPDLVAIAKAFGLDAFRVTSGAEMERVLKTHDVTRGPTLVHVVLDAATVSQELDFALYKSGQPH